MRAIAITLLCFGCSTPIQTKRPKTPKPHRAENAQVVLSNIAQMIGQIGNIIEDPHNPDNVGDSVANMVDNIIRITVHAVNHKKISLSDAQFIMDDLYNICEEVDENLAFIIKRKKLTL